MPTTANTINYYIAADGTLRDGQAGSIAQTPRIYYGTEYAVTLSFPPSTIAEGDQLQVAVNRSRTFFSSASATGDAPVAAVAKHDVTSEEASAQAVTLTLSTNTRAMIDQVNGIDHPVRGFFGVHLLRGQSFVTLAVADAFMMSVESGPDAISPSLPVVDYPTREEAEALTDRSEAAAERAEQAAAGIVPPLQLDAPPTTSTVGSVGQLAFYHDSATNKDHLYHLVYITSSDSATLYHWEECVLESQRNVANGFAGLDGSGKVNTDYLKINVAGGVPKLDSNAQVPKAQLAYATNRSHGIVRGNIDFGTSIGNTYHDIQILPASQDFVNRRVGSYHPITAGAILDYAVRSVLPNVTEIPAATSDYSLVDSSATTLNHSHTFVHTPSQAPTYRLPSVSDTTVSHYIELTVDFTNVQTYSFVPPQDSGVTFQSYANPNQGDVWVFRCVWYGGKWRICPMKIKNCVTRQLTSGALSITDAVAGDALALRMVAPRSVVMNQLVSFSDTISFDYTNTTESPTYPIASDGYGVIHYGLRVTNHVYVARYQSSFTSADTVMFYWSNWQQIRSTDVRDSFVKSTWTGASGDGSSTEAVRLSAVPAGVHVSGTVTIQVVDLTQYFNGDSTLIDSIQSWDDLVAYDSRFASYVQYNTGTVEGVTPSVKVSGKNLLDINGRTAGTLSGFANTTPRTFEYGKYYAGLGNNNYYYSTAISNLSINNGTVQFHSTSWGYGIAFPLKLTPNTQYTVNATFDSNGKISVCFYDKDGTWLSSTANATFITPVNAVTTVIILGVKTDDSDSSFSNIQLELGSTATSYEPYHDGGTATSPIELFAVGNAADEYEAVAGKVTRKMGSVDLGTLNWVHTGSDYGYWYTSISNIKLAPSSYNVGNIIAEHYITIPSNQLNGSSAAIGCIANSTSDNRIFVNNGSTTNPPSGYLYYELATPTASTSTPTQISLQAGNNVAMQTDGGRLAPIDVTYESNEI